MFRNIDNLKGKNEDSDLVINGLDVEGNMMIDEEQPILESQTSLAVKNMKSALAYQGKGVVQKRVGALQD